MSSPFAPPEALHTPQAEDVPASPTRTAVWQLLAAFGLVACLSPAALQWWTLASSSPAPTSPRFGLLVAASCPLLLGAFASGGAGLGGGLTVLDHRASVRAARWIWLGIAFGLGITPLWIGATVLLTRRYSLMAAP